MTPTGGRGIELSLVYKRVFLLRIERRAFKVHIMENA